MYIKDVAENEFKILEIIFDPSLVLSPHVFLLSSEITGFDQVTHPYNLRYAGAKAFYNSSKVTDALQNVILQHVDICTFVRYYEVDVDVDIQGIVRKTESQTPLVRFACLFSASINPNRLFRLSAEESKSLNKLPVVLARQEKHVNMAASHCVEDCNPDLWLQKKLELLEDRTMEVKRRYNIAICELRNKKQRQQNQQIWENLKHYRNK
ncbi:hypothetical protein BDV09DRAFT_204184 [Aspergillus tetrazonus]